MLQGDALRELTRPDRTYLLSVCLLPGLLYPVWYLFGPRAAADPWIAWFAVGAAFVIVGGLSLASRLSARALERLYLACLYLSVSHLYMLAYLNGMHAFYAAGSAVAPVAAAAVIRTSADLRPYALFVVGMSLLMFLTSPDSTKLAYWGSSAVVLGIAYYRHVQQSGAARAAREREAQLEARVAESLRELGASTSELERQRDERHVLEEQLRFSQKLEAVGRLAGGVAHDFNNLLTAIGGYAMLLRNQVPEGEPREDVAQIELAVQQATALVQQLLSFGRRQLVPTRILDLNEIVSEVSTILRTLLAEDTELRILAADALDPIRANRNQLHQVLLNLAINARDAMPSGGHLTIETRVVSPAELDPEVASLLDAERWVLLAVSDSGVGMEPEVRERAFDPFFTTKGVEQGTGLGLSIVYGIVRQSGGHIRLRSERGDGTRFEIYWPSALGAEASAPALDAPILSGRRETILLVEDRDDVRRLVQRILEQNGYTVIEARDGKEALDIARRRGQPVDLVLSDVIMPRMSGFDLVEELTRERPETKVLLISGHLNHPAVRSRNLEQDFTLLPKPFAPAELLASVRQTLDRDRPRETGPPN